MSIRVLLVVGGAAVAGYVITLLLLPVLGLAGDPGPPFTGAIVYAVVALVVLVLLRRRRGTESRDNGRT